MMHIPKGLIPSLRAWRRRFATGAGAGGLAAITLVASGTAWGLAGHPGAGTGAQQLTTNTSVCGGPAAKGVMRCFAVVRTPSSHVITANTAGPPSTALTPADIQSAYKLPSATAGGGQTVAIVDAGDDPTAEADLATFRFQYGLPPCTTANGCLKIVNQAGQASPLPPVQCSQAAGGCWPVEESLDLDAVSAACPNCNILLVEATDATNNLFLAENEAVALGAKFVSNSWGGPEYSGETQDSQTYFNHPGVAITASTGDSGYGVSYPSASQYVTAVGGTTLTKDTSVPRGWTETVWAGTGSGCSAAEPQPSFQQGISQLTAVCENRAVADMSADADPASGLAIYDSNGFGGVNGWVQVGGTSLASPLIAATYALAGAPASGTYPNAAPYHDPSQSSDLFDITSGSNGGCGNVLCTAGPGWDGPTGLGTPDGVKAFQGAPQGQISGQVTDKTTGKPVTGVTVTAQPGDYVARTDASGNYQLNIAAGSYTLTVTDYGYQTATQTGVTVTASQTTTENYALAPGAFSTLSGTVTDGSGHGWPLYARITISGYPAGPVFTDPVTGRYSVKLADDTSYTLHVQPVYPGYQASDTQVQLGSADQVQDIKPAADLAACTAPGYGWNGLTETFTGWAGATPGDGWHVSGTPDGWRFDNPGNRTPPPGSLGEPLGDDSFAIVDAAAAGQPGRLDATLTSPGVDLAGQQAPHLAFDTSYYPYGRGQDAQVQVSTDGGATWQTVWQQTRTVFAGHVDLPIPQAAGHAQVIARFRYSGADGWWWAVDNVFLGTHTCIPHAGGLVTGVVTAAAGGAPIEGATVSAANTPGSATTIAIPDDPANPGGFYWLFTPAGTWRLTAAADGYTPAAATVTITPGTLTYQDFTLAASS